MEFNFKVGDLVQFNDSARETTMFKSTSERFTVVRVGHRIGGSDWLNYQLRDIDGYKFYVRSKWITLCSTCNNNPPQEAKKESSTMSTISNAVSKVRQLAMSKDDRLLRKYGIVNDCGEITPDGTALLIDLLFADNKSAVVSKLDEIDAEEKKNKK